MKTLDDKTFILDHGIDLCEDTYQIPNTSLEKQIKGLNFYIWATDDMMAYLRDAIYRENDPWKVNKAQNDPDFISEANFYADYYGDKNDIKVSCVYHYYDESNEEQCEVASLILTSKNKEELFVAMEEYCMQEDEISLLESYLVSALEVEQTDLGSGNVYAICDYRKNDNVYLENNDNVVSFSTQPEAENYLEDYVSELVSAVDEKSVDFGSLSNQISDARCSQEATADDKDNKTFNKSFEI